MAPRLPPDIFEFDATSDFLKAWFKHAKDSGRPMSHEVAGRRVGLNRGHLASLVNGYRKMPIDLVPAFAELLQLNVAQAAFLGALVERDRARTPAGKHEAQAKVIGLRKQQARPRADEANKVIFDHWYLPVIIELSSLPGFRRDAAWISERLSPSISVEQAASALNVLDQLGLMADEVSTGMGDIPSFGRAYHQQMIGHAATAIDRIPWTEREVHSFTTAASPEMVKELHAEIRRSVERWLALCAESSDVADRVMQVCVQSFPVTGISETPPEDEG